MDTSVELKKYHIMEYLMNISDLKLLEKVEKMITESGSLSKKEMLKQAKERLSKWMK